MNSADEKSEGSSNKDQLDQIQHLLQLCKLADPTDSGKIFKDELIAAIKQDYKL